jgi:GT2 family glycosyltransferase
VRSGRQPRGFVEVDIVDGCIAGDELRKAAAALPEPAEVRPMNPLPPVSVVLCTRDRPAALETALASLLDADYPSFQVVVVDNASRTQASARVVTAIGDPRVRLVEEPRPGLARARNRGIVNSTHEIIAFTDDDVIVDRWWLRGLVDGLTAGEDVACVCGMVPSGELRSFPQAYFDARVTWARNCSRRVFSLAEPPGDEHLFPFQVGQFGTGANFAIRRSVVLDLGGFDEALGVGSQTQGGEDIDMFVRVLLAGHELVYEPSAIVWHRHREDMADLHRQIEGYGLGLGAWITKLLCDRRTAPLVLQRSLRGIVHARQMTRVDLTSQQMSGCSPAAPRLRAVELRALARGPLAYARARFSGARRAPLRGLTGKV